MPYVESPLVGVVSMMPGPSAEEMEIYFSKPIEERMVDVKNVHFVRSTSQEGFSIVTVEFQYGTDMKKALFDVQSLMNVVQADLPMTGANLKPSWVLPIDPLNIPILSLAVMSEGYDPVELRTLVENEVVNRLKTVRDVQSVVPFGGQKLQMQVVADRDRLAAYKMTLLDVKAMLDGQNQSRPAGTLTFRDREMVVRADGRARTADDVGAYPIAGMDGRVVSLCDVAEVLDAPREQRSLYRFNGREAVEVSVIQQPDASSVRVIAGVRAKLAELQQDFPRLSFAVAYDNSTFVGFLMANMVEELVVAVALTGVVVLLFLGNLRGTLIAVIGGGACRLRELLPPGRDQRHVRLGLDEEPGSGSRGGQRLLGRRRRDPAPVRRVHARERAEDGAGPPRPRAPGGGAGAAAGRQGSDPDGAHARGGGEERGGGLAGGRAGRGGVSHRRRASAEWPRHPGGSAGRAGEPHPLPLQQRGRPGRVPGRPGHVAPGHRAPALSGPERAGHKASDEALPGSPGGSPR
jgi:hypothetical protein